MNAKELAERLSKVCPHELNGWCRFCIPAIESILSEALASERRDAFLDAAKMVDEWTIWTPSHVKKLVEKLRQKAGEGK